MEISANEAQLAKMNDCLKQIKSSSDKMRRSCSVYLGAFAAAMIFGGIACFWLAGKVRVLLGADRDSMFPTLSLAPSTKNFWDPSNWGLDNVTYNLLKWLGLPDQDDLVDALNAFGGALNELVTKEFSASLQSTGVALFVFSVLLGLGSIYIWRRPYVRSAPE